MRELVDHQTSFTECLAKMLGAAVRQLASIYTFVTVCEIENTKILHSHDCQAS